jgi:hypothetical protein
VSGPAKPGLRLRWMFARVENFDAGAAFPEPTDS